MLEVRVFLLAITLQTALPANNCCNRYQLPPIALPLISEHGKLSGARSTVFNESPMTSSIRLRTADRAFLLGSPPVAGARSHHSARYITKDRNGSMERAEIALS